jgi:hypothetical protein
MAPNNNNVEIDIDIESCVGSNPFEYNLSNSLKYTFKYVMAHISTEEDAVRYCMDVGLIKNKFECPKCSLSMHESLTWESDGTFLARWRCGRKNCNVDRSMRSGSFFKGSKLRWTTLVHLLWCWSAREPVTAAYQKAGCDKKTAIDWYQFCRDVCSKEMGSISLKVTVIYQHVLTVIYARCWKIC